MFDGTVGHLQPMLKVEVFPFCRGQIYYLLDDRPVFRVGSLQNELDRKLGCGVEFEYSKHLSRPVELSGRNIPAEAPRAGQPLRLRQVSLRLPQVRVEARVLERNSCLRG